MGRPRHRRTTLLGALVALPALACPAQAAGSGSPAPGGAKPASPAAAPPETLWDVLSRIDSAETAAHAARSALDGPFNAVRRPLGAVPGFTLPGAAGDAKQGAGFIARRRPGPFGSFSSWLERLGKATGTSIKVRGSSTLTYSAQSVSGGPDAQQSYTNDYYLGRGSNGLYNDTNVDVDATLFHSIHYQTHISNYLYGRPDDNKVKLDYQSKAMRLEMGDINGSINGNSLIGFSRYLQGAEITNRWTNHLSTTLLVSQTRAQPQTRLIQGANSAGPYYVFAGQIVDGSVQVRVDNKPMQEGKDYTLDTQTGELNFLGGIVVLQSSTIAVTYESLGYNQTQGSIYGFRSDYNLKGATRVGFTYLTQLSHQGSGLQSDTQQFYGNENPLSPYVLDYPIDTTKPMSVTVAGVPKQLNVDYKIDAQYPNQIRILQGVPSTQIVLIKYVPLGGALNPGNRTIYGLDGSLSLGRVGALSIETAMSGLSLSGSNAAGNAMQLRATLHPTRNLNTNITLRDISPNFTGIESAGFQLNEKSVDISSDYTPVKRLHLTADWQTSRRPSYVYPQNGSTFSVTTHGNDAYNQYTLGVTYDFSKNGSLNYSRSSMGTRYAIGGNSASLSDTLGVHYTLGQIALDTGISRNTSNANTLYSLLGVASSTTSANQPYDVVSSTFSKHVGLNWTPKNWFHLATNLSSNDISDTGTGTPMKTTATNADVTAGFTLRHGASIEYGYSLSDTGNVSGLLSPASGSGSTGSTSNGSSGTSGSSNTTGVSSNGTVTSRGFFAPWVLGIAPTRQAVGGSLAGGITGTGVVDPTLLGGGFNNSLGQVGNYSGVLGYGSSSLSNIYSVASLAGRSGTNHITINFNPTARLHTSLSLLSSSSVGSYEYNSSRSDAALNIGWTASRAFQITASFDISKIAYTGSVGGSSTRNMMLDMEGRAFRKLNVRLGWQFLQNKSAIDLSGISSGTTGTGTAGSTTGTSLTNTSSNISDILLHVDYPLNRRESLFVDLNNSVTTGYLGSVENDIRFGLQFHILQPLNFDLGWQILNHRNLDPSEASYNYHSSSLLAQLGFTF